MSTWIFNIFTSVFLISVISLLLPEGRLSKFVKPFMSFILIVIILSPIIDFKVTIENLNINNTTIKTDEAFLNTSIIAKIDNYEQNCIKLAQNIGINGASAVIEYSVDENYSLKIYGATINLQNAVISSESEHIVILQRLKREICGYLSLSEQGVKIIE